MAKLRNPTVGYDAAGADAYAAVVSAPSGAGWTRLLAVCQTHPAKLSFDAGTTDNAVVVPGAATLLEGVEITGAVHAKNANAGSSYADLGVMVW